MLVRSIFLDIGKLLDGSFALGGATSVQIHAAHAIRLRARMRLSYLMSLPAVRGASPQAIATAAAIARALPAR
jgi:hypothetical protein